MQARIPAGLTGALLGRALFITPATAACSDLAGEAGRAENRRVELVERQGPAEALARRLSPGSAARRCPAGGRRDCGSRSRADCRRR